MNFQKTILFTLKDYFLLYLISLLVFKYLVEKTVSQPLCIQHSLGGMFCYELRASLGKVGGSLE